MEAVAECIATKLRAIYIQGQVNKTRNFVEDRQ